VEDLHRIYIKLDTYGRNSVAKRNFIAYFEGKLRRHQQLLSAEAVHFTEIRRGYSLARLLLIELEHSTVRDAMPWSELLNFLQYYYQSESRPTIDVIQQRKVISGKIKGSHIYLVSKEFLDLLRKAFEKCDKRYCYFANKFEFL